jgi:hypothetical protein
MSNTDLQDELFVALDHAEMLARTQMAGVIQYLSLGQQFSVGEIRSLVEEILAQYPNNTPPRVAKRLFLVQ